MWTGNPGALSDLQGFTDGVEDRVAFVSHVREVDAAVLACHARQLDELVRAGVNRGGVDQRRRDPHGAVFHGLPHEGLHLFDLGRVGRTSRSPSTTRLTCVRPTSWTTLMGIPMSSRIAK